MTKTIINIESVYRYSSYYSTAVKAGNTIYVCGLTGVDVEGKAGEDVEAQAVLIFENLKKALATAGATLDDVVMMTTYYNGDMRHSPKWGEVRTRYFREGHYPASTGIAVAALASPDLFAEADFIAVIGEER